MKWLFWFSLVTSVGRAAVPELRQATETLKIARTSLDHAKRLREGEIDKLAKTLGRVEALLVARVIEEHDPLVLMSELVSLRTAREEAEKLALRHLPVDWRRADDSALEGERLSFRIALLYARLNQPSKIASTATEALLQIRRHQNYLKVMRETQSEAMILTEKSWVLLESSPQKLVELVRLTGPAVR